MEMRDVYEYIRDEIADALGETVFNGTMPPTEGLALMIDMGTVDTTFLTAGISYNMGMTLNGKGKNQVEVYNKLCQAHKLLTQKKTWASGETWQITNVSTDSMPRLLGREDNVNWEYGSGLTVRFVLFNKEIYSL